MGALAWKVVGRGRRRDERLAGRADRRQRLARGQRVLDLFSYTGAWGLQAAAVLVLVAQTGVMVVGLIVAPVPVNPVVALVNLVVDVSYAFLNPRIRYGGGE